MIKEIAALFFKLGWIAFGGPAAHIAMLEDEVVVRRKWMDRQHFLDLVGATNLIPGPNSTEMVMHCGYERGGWPGLFVAGICFIFPAVLLTGILAFLYVNYGTLPAVEPFLFGIKPAVLAIIASALYRLGKKALKNTELVVLAVLVMVAALFQLSEVLVLLVGGLVGALYFYFRHRPETTGTTRSAWPILLLQASWWSAGKGIGAAKIFWTFLKVGAILYGSGYVLFAYLDAEIVARGWLSRAELLDAIAVGQFTPGPVLSTSTFIGYQLGGVSGAIAATIGIFLPSFLFVLLLNPLIPRMRESRFLGYFLDAVNAAAVAVIAAVLLEMGYAVLIFDWRAIVVAAAAFGAVFGPRKVSSIWIVVGGAVLGYGLQFIS